MNKLTDLRNHLLASIPALAAGPDRLLTFVEDGKIKFWDGENLSHSMDMVAKIIVTDWRDSPDAIILPILIWMHTREPGRNPEEAIRFEAEIVSADSVDLAISLDLTERVIVYNEPGGYRTEHVLPPAPAQMNPDAALRIDATGPSGDDSYLVADYG